MINHNQLPVAVLPPNKRNLTSGSGDDRSSHRGFDVLARVERVTPLRDGGRPGVAASAVVEGVEVFLPLEGLIDVAEERARLLREADKLLHDLDVTRRKLRNQDFLNKARPDVVEREHQRLAQLEETLDKLKRAQESLRGAEV